MQGFLKLLQETLAKFIIDEFFEENEESNTLPENISGRLNYINSYLYIIIQYANVI
ncbi:MAG: hypothetical protein IK065_03310 [Neisseriaceae bacterium]|nr:hypothetical protein [Neisseriaceae bacterium]